MRKQQLKKDGVSLQILKELRLYEQIGFSDGLTNSDLRERLDLPDQRVSGRITDLIRLGMVYRCGEEINERGQIVAQYALTASGRELLRVNS